MIIALINRKVTKRIMRYILFLSIVLSTALVQAQEVEATKDSNAPSSKFVGVRFQPIDTVSTFLKKITVKGEARMQAIYRVMDQSYADQLTPDKDLSFQSYPTGGGGSGNGSAVPLFNINILANPTPDFSVDLGYALGHNFSGTQDTSNRSAVVRSNLNFTGKLNTTYGLFKIRAGGGVLWTSLSPMTISQNEFQNDGFDRLPWDWFTKSYDKYNAIYEGTSSLGSEVFGSEAFQGVDFQGSGLPGGFGFIAMYGRTARSVDAGKAREAYPSYIAAGRVDNAIGNAIIGFNYYGQMSDTSASLSILDYKITDTDTTAVLGTVADNRQIITADVRYNLDGIEIYTELGVGKVNNPLNSNTWSPGIMVSCNIPDKKFGWPIKAKIYNIDHEFVSNVSTVMNSNNNAANNGVNQDANYRTTVFINSLQEVGQITNNRRGLSVSSGKKVGKFKFEFGYGVSQELENIYDIITFQHRSNAFSRSRFTPWVQAAGPYKRIKNMFRRTFEFVQITDEDQDYLKGFNQIEFTAKYKLRVAHRNLIIRNFTSYGSSQDGLSFIPVFSSEAFLRSTYNQTLAMYELGKKVSLVAMFEFERNIANDRTELSSVYRKAMDQYSEGYGVGIDYDFSNYAGLYLRHRWMYHDDVNFVKDKFQGQETTVELKVFF